MNPIELNLRVTIDEANVRAIINAIRQALQFDSDADVKREARMKASRNALLAGQKPPEDQELVIDMQQVADLLKVSPRTINKMERCGEMPKAIRINRVVRWSFYEITAWIEAGCPLAKEWKSRWKRANA